MTHRLMTEDEKVAVTMKAIALYKAGKKEESMALHKTVPMPAWLAKFYKENGCSDFLVDSGWNMAEAEAEFGKDWFNS